MFGEIFNLYNHFIADLISCVIDARILTHRVAYT